MKYAYKNRIINSRSLPTVTTKEMVQFILFQIAINYENFHQTECILTLNQLIKKTKRVETYYEYQITMKGGLNHQFPKFKTPKKALEHFIKFADINLAGNEII
jgi:hypothetical protein